MKDDLKEYKQKLEKELSAYMELPVSERSAAAVRGMAECWEQVDKLGKCMCASADFSKEDAKAWNTDMENDDGTTGGHWTVQQTTPLAANAGVVFAYITEDDWNVAMNMMYSDYCSVAAKYGVNKPEFFADMAKAFLFDKDAKGPKEKLSAYYHKIAAV
nr:MAG TPA: hypothetical protein [Caudoviricetes sp.]